MGKTTAELQTPTGYTGIYTGWLLDFDNADGDFDDTTGVDDFWDFGTSGQYPALKADLNGDGVATWEDFGDQRVQSPTPVPSPAPTIATPNTYAAHTRARGGPGTGDVGIQLSRISVVLRDSGKQRAIRRDRGRSE